MKALEVEFLRGKGLHQRRHLLDVDAELLRPAAHLHARALEFEIGIDAHRHPRRQAERLRDRAQQGHLAHRLDVDEHPRCHRLAQLDLALAGAGEADLGRVGAGVQRDLELARRGHVDPVHQPRHAADERRHGVGLHGVVQLDGWRQRGAQRADAVDEGGPVVGIERRAADPLDELRQRDAAEHELAADAAELRHGSVGRRA